jgi:hypothetical protein
VWLFCPVAAATAALPATQGERGEAWGGGGPDGAQACAVLAEAEGPRLPPALSALVLPPTLGAGWGRCAGGGRQALRLAASAHLASAG